MATYVIHASGGRRVLDMVDVDSEKFTAAYAKEPPTFQAGSCGRVKGERYWRLSAGQRSGSTTLSFVSEQEWQRFVTLAPETVARTGWVSNGVDFDHFSPAHVFVPPFAGVGADVVFTGRMDYLPNIDAVLRFAHEVLPVLRLRIPTARLWIVGEPSAAVRALARLPGVQVTGRVADTRPWLRRGSMS